MGLDDLNRELKNQTVPQSLLITKDAIKRNKLNDAAKSTCHLESSVLSRCKNFMEVLSKGDEPPKNIEEDDENKEDEPKIEFNILLFEDKQKNIVCHESDSSEVSSSEDESSSDEEESSQSKNKISLTNKLVLIDDLTKDPIK